MPSATSVPVPAEYRALYAELDKRLDEFQTRLDALPKTEARPIIFAGDLLAANGNRGEELLRAQTFAGVQAYLDSLQALGARGVKVAIKYPLFLAEFPRAQEYVAFYKRVAQELKRRKMTMLASCGAVFAGTIFSNVEWSYKGILHIYPINRDYPAHAIENADAARAANKRVVIGETWLYKAGERDPSTSSGRNATEEDVFVRDVYSFWSPLDAKQLTLIAQFARHKQIEFLSPFWTRYFYGYLDYAQTRGLSNKQLLDLANVEASQNIVAGKPTATGGAYKVISSQ